MSSAERPEADAAEQARPVDPDTDDRDEPGPDLTPDVEAALADVLDQLAEVDLPDEDDSRM
jgi:hypothetical protein